MKTVRHLVLCANKYIEVFNEHSMDREGEHWYAKISEVIHHGSQDKLRVVWYNKVKGKLQLTRSKEPKVDEIDVESVIKRLKLRRKGKDGLIYFSRVEVR